MYRDPMIVERDPIAPRRNARLALLLALAALAIYAGIYLYYVAGGA